MMGRLSAYSGKFVTWDQIKESNLNICPELTAFADFPGAYPENVVPLPGTAPTH
jgi:hypothetical protein